MTDKFGSIFDQCTLDEDQMVGGQHFRKGQIISRIETAEFNNALHQFPALIVWKLYLDMALESQAEALDIASLFKRKLQKSKTKNKKRIYGLTFDQIDKPEILLAYFKAIISSYIFSFSALEAYINDRIDSFIPTTEDYAELQALTKNAKNSPILQTKNDLIKECSIKEKLLSIIPHFLKKKGSNYKISKAHKRDFDIMLFVRNELTHPKRLKQRSFYQNGTYKTSKLWNKLIPSFNGNNGEGLVFHPATTAESIINILDEKFLDSQSKIKIRIQEL